MDHRAAICLNCRAGLLGEYCHECGQSAHIHRTLAAWWHDLTHGVLHVEGAVWRTLVMLLRAPGPLTRRYIAGERRRFLAPLPLYLFSVFVLYVVFALFGGIGHIDLDRPDPAALARAVHKLDAAIVAAQGSGGQAAPTGAGHLAELQAERTRLLRAQAEGGDAPGGGVAAALERHRTGWKRLDEGLLHAARDPDFLVFKLEADGYKFSWLLIPISVPLMGLLFAWRRSVHLFDHAVFVTYSLSFVSLLLTVMVLAVWLHLPGQHWLLLAFPLHLLFQLRGAYRLSVPATLLCEVAVLAIAALSLLVWIGLLLGLGLLA